MFVGDSAGRQQFTGMLFISCILFEILMKLVVTWELRYLLLIARCGDATMAAPPEVSLAAVASVLSGVYFTDRRVKKRHKHVFTLLFSDFSNSWFTSWLIWLSEVSQRCADIISTPVRWFCVMRWNSPLKEILQTLQTDSSVTWPLIGRYSVVSSESKRPPLTSLSSANEAAAIISLIRRTFRVFRLA